MRRYLLGTRATRTLAAGVLLVALALSMAAVPAAEACTLPSDTCGGEIAKLQSDVGTYVPATQATSILSRISRVATPGDPCAPTDPMGSAFCVAFAAR
jgi:hypothetical protein